MVVGAGGRRHAVPAPAGAGTWASLSSRTRDPRLGVVGRSTPTCQPSSQHTPSRRGGGDCRCGRSVLLPLQPVRQLEVPRMPPAWLPRLPLPDGPALHPPHGRPGPLLGLPAPPGHCESLVSLSVRDASSPQRPGRGGAPKALPDTRPHRAPGTPSRTLSLRAVDAQGSGHGHTSVGPGARRRWAQGRRPRPHDEQSEGHAASGSGDLDSTPRAAAEACPAREIAPPIIPTNCAGNSVQMRHVLIAPAW